MKTETRMTAAALLVLLLAAGMLSCADAGTAETQQTTSMETEPVTEAVTEDPAFRDSLPDADLNGYQYRMAIFGTDIQRIMTFNDDEDGNIVRNSVRTFGDLDVAASYNSNREPQYFEIIGNDFWCCYLPGQGWSSSLGEYQPIDAPAGLENVDFEYLMNYATCTIPCDHNWVEADCDTPKTCSVCKATEGEALGHDYIDATTEAPKTCKNCGATDGEPLPKPAEPAETNWFIRIWNAILDFFRKLFGLK